MEIIREKKTILIEILSADTDFILQHVHQEKLITDRDYRALKSLPQNTDKISVELLDKLRDRGKDTCQKFLKLLEQQHILKQYPRLSNVFSDRQQGSMVPTAAALQQDIDHKSKIDEYKTSIRSTYKTVREYNFRPGDRVLLTERYSELLILETQRKKREREEEISFKGKHHQQVLKARASDKAHSRITVEQLFKPDEDDDIPKAVVLQGHSGHGKSFTVQKIMFDWASGKLFKDTFHLVLHLKCKELNTISGDHSLVELLSQSPGFTSDTAELLKDPKMKVLFIIDGFDELKFSFEETGPLPPKDPFTKAPFEATLSALLKGHILPKCFLLVTTRSTTSEKLSKLLCDSWRFSDILGFTEEGVKEYFQRFFRKSQLAEKAFTSVRADETLYTTCFVPVICWIVCTVLMEQAEEGMDITKGLKTTTSIFLHFVTILLKHHCQGVVEPETLLRSLGQLAERGLHENQVLFDEKSLSVAFPDPSQATKNNPFICKFLLKVTDGLEPMYSFMHLSFQEFFAALQHLMTEEMSLEWLFGIRCFKPVVQFLFGLSNRDISKRLTETKHSWFARVKEQSLASIRALLQKRLLSFLRNNREQGGTRWGRAGWMYRDEEGEDDYCQYSPMQQGEESMHVLHCLYELHEEEFVREAMEAWGKMEFDIPLTRTDCWVLLYCLRCCQTITSLRLTRCNITPEKLRMLQPALGRCEELGLTLEDLSDADVGDLNSALGEVKSLSEVSMENGSLSQEGVEQVLGNLSKHKSVGEVILNVMTNTASTMTLCLDFIQNTKTGCSLTLKDNSLRIPFLSMNKDSGGLRLTLKNLSDAGVNDLISALREVKILSELSLKRCHITGEKVGELQPVLSRCENLGLDLTGLSDGIGAFLITLTGRNILKKLSLHFEMKSDLGIGPFISSLGEYNIFMEQRFMLSLNLQDRFSTVDLSLISGSREHLQFLGQFFQSPICVGLPCAPYLIRMCPSLTSLRWKKRLPNGRKLKDSYIVTFCLEKDDGIISLELNDADPEAAVKHVLLTFSQPSDTAGMNEDSPELRMDESDEDQDVEDSDMSHTLPQSSDENNVNFESCLQECHDVRMDESDEDQDIEDSDMSHTLSQSSDENNVNFESCLQEFHDVSSSLDMGGFCDDWDLGSLLSSLIHVPGLNEVMLEVNGCLPSSWDTDVPSFLNNCSSLKRLELQTTYLDSWALGVVDVVRTAKRPDCTVIIRGQQVMTLSSVEEIYHYGDYITLTF